MLSKEDYQNYLKQIVKLEREMSAVYKDCSVNVNDENIKGKCRGLSVAEEKHAVMVEELLNLLKI
jgi:rubrerythrin